MLLSGTYNFPLRGISCHKSLVKRSLYISIIRAGSDFQTVPIFRFISDQNFFAKVYSHSSLVSTNIYTLSTLQNANVEATIEKHVLKRWPKSFLQLQSAIEIKSKSIRSNYRKTKTIRISKNYLIKPLVPILSLPTRKS